MRVCLAVIYNLGHVMVVGLVVCVEKQNANIFTITKKYGNNCTFFTHLDKQKTVYTYTTNITFNANDNK